ncbi:glycosyltransferase family A protein [uncultured Metabacillus sp.]|uniref:glycosyltransferase family 2 protein n=1 Tax=uncultured Metabacillus sp. TaxID=2860135 RepID=UPI002631F8E9|nr:glycosyltransferase family A protein [uncultured Metabacillus sp.]
MKDLHVFLLDYSSQTVFTQTLYSLHFISHRLKSLTLIKREKTSSLHIDKSLYHYQVINMTEDDLGKTLNGCIPTITTDYVLFLYKDEQLISNIDDAITKLSDKNHILTNSLSVKNYIIERPFLVKTSYLKQTPLFTKEQIPFNEAVLPAWLKKIEKAKIVKITKPMVKPFNPRAYTKTINKWEFIAKYSSPLKRAYDQSPSLAVMISTYNMASYVETAITSCLLQHTPINQLLVIDDGSTDKTYERLTKWNGERNIRVFQKENEGKARALNQLLPYVSSDFILELDADDWLDPDAISTIKEQIMTLPLSAAVLYGNLRNWRQFDSNEMKFSEVTNGKPVMDENELLSYHFPLGPRIYRTDKLKAIGGFPVISFEEGKLYEDVLVLKELMKTGPLCYRDFTIYNVRNHQSSITKVNHSKWHEFKNLLD